MGGKEDFRVWRGVVEKKEGEGGGGGGGGGGGIKGGEGVEVRENEEEGVDEEDGVLRVREGRDEMRASMRAKQKQLSSSLLEDPTSF